MTTGFTLFGPLHLAILASTVALPWLAARWTRGKPAARQARITLGALLGLNELGWYWFRYSSEGFRFPDGLPLQLCDVALWLAVGAGLTARRGLLELGWYWGVAGASMALLTPDLWAPCWTYPTIYFFIAHCGMVATLLYLPWSGQARPRAGSQRRAFLWLLGFAAALGAFNLVFGTNYMYLCSKPDAASLLDWFGPWPVYLLPGGLLGAALFWLLGLPWRRGQS
jgi:hypothetical integral membrane protein (TIGR02206 family)